MRPSGLWSSLSARSVAAACLGLLALAATTAGLLDGDAAAGPWRTVSLVAGAAMLGIVATGRQTGVPWTWLMLGSGTLISAIVTRGVRYEEALSIDPMLSAGGFALAWVGIWMFVQQRLRTGHVAFVLDALGWLAAVVTLVCTIAVVGYGPFRDGSELMYVLGLCTTIMLAATVPLIAAIGKTRFCARDAWLTAAFAAGAVGWMLITVALRRDLPLVAPGLAASELVLPLMAIAASRRPGRAGARKLGDWWEWVPPTAWALVAGITLVLGTRSQVPGELLVAACLTLVFAVTRFAFTLREVGAAVLERHESLTDELTGLPNRHAFFEALELMTLSRGASGERATLIVVGIDDFRSLNDTLGHHAGEALIRSVGDRLEERCAGNGEAHRLGEVAFAVLVRGANGADALARRLLDCFTVPFPVEGVNVTLGASLGLARFPEDATSSRELARRGEVAMSDAHRRRVGIARYDSSRDWYSVAHLALADELRAALRVSGGGLWLGFQPQLDLRRGCIAGVESLVRWRHPELGNVSPADLLPIAERSGLMAELTDWVLDRTAESAAALADNEGFPLRFAVNVSAATLVDVRLPERIATILAVHGVAPERLLIEVTEDAVMSDRDRCMAVLGRIRRLGVEVSIDDFGTGHSTLAQVRALPAGELKIDRGFVRGMASDRVDAEIVRLIVALGREVGMRVVAEGVETEAEREALAGFGCELIQGYAVAKPMPYAELVAFLREHETLPRAA